jgi:hypothetical protein
MPEYANITSAIDAPSALHDGTSPSAKLTWLQSTNQMPIAASRNKGVSLSAASATIARAPSFTPNAFSANNAPYTPVINSARGPPGAKAGTRLATCSDNAAATPALEVMLLIHISAPAMKPANWPKVAVR